MRAMSAPKRRLRSPTIGGGALNAVASSAPFGKCAASGAPAVPLDAARDVISIASGAMRTELTAGRAIGGYAPRDDRRCTTNASPGGSLSESARMAPRSFASIGCSAGALISSVLPMSPLSITYVRTNSARSGSSRT